MSLYKYFTAHELACKCGCGKGITDMDTEFMAVLDKMRGELGFALPVTSGYRCPAHNASISKTGSSGPHTTGKAVDIAVDRHKGWQVMDLATTYGMSVGVSQKGSTRFLHLDVVDRGPELTPTIWSY